MGLNKRLYELMNDKRKLSSQMRRARRSAGLPFELTLESHSEADKFARSQDKDSLKKFNKDVEQWAEQTKSLLRVSIKSLVRRDVYLSDSLKTNLYYDRKYAKEVNRVGFSFAREGIYIHKGAGRGQGGLIGGRWIDRHGVEKTRAAASAGLQGKGNRKPIEWFNPVVKSRLPQLADIIADYSLTMQIDATRIFIE